NVGWRLLTGRFFASGTEYMWDGRFPLWVRLLSMFHVLLPCALIWGMWKLGYDRRALRVQAGIAAGVILASRFLSPALDSNWAERDPLFDRAWGPGVVHLAVIWVGAVVLLYWPTHLVLGRVFGGKRQQRKESNAET